MTARIVVIEDDPSVAELVTLYLRNADFIVEHARTASEARKAMGDVKPALVVLDLGLPDADGLELFREIRSHADTPVLALTARAEDVQKIEALEQGMDDYLTKPFNPKELVARVRAVLRRVAGMPGGGRTLEVGNVRVGRAAAAVTIAGLLLRYENDQTRLRLEELSAPFLTAIQTGVRSGQQPREIVEALTEQARAANARLLVITPQRRVVVDSDGTLVNFTIPPVNTANIGTFTEKDEQWIFVRQQLLRAVVGAGGQGFIVVARPRAVFADTIRDLLPALLISA